jgi:hypothetical protein
MATKDYGQTYYPLDSAGFDPAADMEAMAESLEGRTVRTFTTTGARDTAVATLTSEQKKGLICHVQGSGWYGLDTDGTTWRRFSMLGITHNRGTAQGNCDSNGIYSVNHGLSAAPVSVQVTMEGDNTQIKYLSPVVVLIDSTRILTKFWYNDPSGGALQVNAGAYTSFHWRAEL